MTVTIRARNTGLPSGGMFPGGIIQVSSGFNTTSSSAVFTRRNGWSHVPGRLQCALRPEAIGNKVHLEAKLQWGGYQGTNESGGYDMAVGFRFFKRVNGSGWYSAGNILLTPQPGTNVETRVGTGTYRYAWDLNTTNGNAWGDWMQYTDTVSETGLHEYCVFWSCLYEGSAARTILWNRSYNTGNSYNPTNTCCIVATEIKA